MYFPLDLEHLDNKDLGFLLFESPEPNLMGDKNLWTDHDKHYEELCFPRAMGSRCSESIGKAVSPGSQPSEIM